jgi:hypothetical protein
MRKSGIFCPPRKTSEENKMDKKGQQSDLKKTFLMVALILVLIGAILLIPKLLSYFKDNPFSGDFDGDNKEKIYASDEFDPCPCGTDNNKQTTTTGEFCVASYTAAQCGCANKLANLAMQKDTKTKADKTLFFTLPDGKCLYDKDEACKYLIMGNPRFNTEMLTLPAGQCPGLATTK